MRVVFVEGHVHVETRFNGRPTAEVGGAVRALIDGLAPTLLDKGVLSAKAKWVISGQAVQPDEPTIVLGQLPSPELLEVEGPTLVAEAPEGYTAPVYAFVFRPKAVALLEINVSVGVGKEAATQAIALNTVGEGGLKERPQEMLERLVDALDVAGLRAMLLGEAPAAAAAEEDDASDDEQPNSPAAEEQLDVSELQWEHSQTGESLVRAALLREGASAEARRAVAGVLLEAGARVSAEHAGSKPDSPPSPLHLAVARSERALVELMLAHGVDFPVNATCIWEGRRCITPLHLACARADAEAALLLLDARANVNWSGADGRAGGVTPLALAIQSGDVHLVRTLVEDKQADVRLATNDPECARRPRARAPVAEALGAGRRARGRGARHGASCADEPFPRPLARARSFSAIGIAGRSSGGAPMVELLTSYPRAVSQLCYSRTPAKPLDEVMVTACARGWVLVVRELMRRGVDVRTFKHPVRALRRARVRTSCVLHRAPRAGGPRRAAPACAIAPTSLTRAALTRPPGVQDKRTLLIDAVLNGHVETARALLEAGVNPNDSGPASKLTPITAAACLADPVASRRLVHMLRAAGADAARHDGNNRQALEYAKRLEGPNRERSERIVADLEGELPEPKLPQFWTSAVDPDIGKTYYYHVLSKKVQWEMPTEDPWELP